MISSSQRPLPDNTQHSQQTNIQALGGIRTHNPSKRAAADPRLRPRGYWDRLFTLRRINNKKNYFESEEKSVYLQRKWIVMQLIVVFNYCGCVVLLRGQNTTSLDFLIIIRQKECTRENSWNKKYAWCLYTRRQFLVCLDAILKKRGPFWENKMFLEGK